MVKERIHSSWGLRAQKRDTRMFKDRLTQILLDEGLSKSLFCKRFKRDGVSVGFKDCENGNGVYRLTSVYIDAKDRGEYNKLTEIVKKELQIYQGVSGIVITGPGFVN